MSEHIFTLEHIYITKKNSKKFLYITKKNSIYIKTPYIYSLLNIYSLLRVNIYYKKKLQKISHFKKLLPKKTEHYDSALRGDGPKAYAFFCRGHCRRLLGDVFI